MYHLLYDQQKQVPQTGYLGGELGEASTAQLTCGWGSSAFGTQHPRQQESSHQRRLLAQKQWNLGVHVCGIPQDIASRLFEVLRRHNVIWKKIGPYCFKCCKVIQPEADGADMNEDSEIENSKTDHSIIKFEIQIYKVRNEEYIIDCQVRDSVKSGIETRFLCRQCRETFSQLPIFVDQF